MTRIILTQKLEFNGKHCTRRIEAKIKDGAKINDALRDSMWKTLRLQPRFPKANNPTP